MDTKIQQRLIYPELSYKLVGLCYDIYKDLGTGYPERIYQNAFCKKLKDNEIEYKKENYCKIEIDGERIGGFRLDFLIDNKIIIEFIVRDSIYNKDIAQVLSYLKHNQLKLGIIVLFSKNGVVIKRLVN